MLADFLQTKRSKEEMRAALEVIREFKACEEVEVGLVQDLFAEWWARLEELESYLEFLVEGKPCLDTKRSVTVMEEPE